MKASRFLQMMFLVSHLTLFIKAHSSVIRQNFKFVIDEDVVHNHILEGHVFRGLTVHSAAQCHMMCKDECLCISMNYFTFFQENNCELNVVNKEMAPTALKWKQGVNYYDLMRSYTVEVSCFFFWDVFFFFVLSVCLCARSFQLIKLAQLFCPRYFVVFLFVFFLFLSLLQGLFGWWVFATLFRSFICPFARSAEDVTFLPLTVQKSYKSVSMENTACRSWCSSNL